MKMFRSPQMKTSVNLRRIDRLFVLMLRDASIRERTLSSYRGSGTLVVDTRWWGRHRDTSIQNFSTVSRSFSAVIDTSNRVPPPKTLPTRFLSTDISFSSVSKPKTLLLLCTSLFAPLSAFDWSRISSRLPVTNVTKRTYCHILKHKTQSKINILSLSNVGPVLSLGHFERAIQTRWLHAEVRRWDECLSAGNEVRCRRSLHPNAALYELDERSWAAVLVCLCVVNGQPAFLFTLRSAQLKGRHKGDVRYALTAGSKAHFSCFAGGKKDSSDRTVIDTALREAREELGIHIIQDQVWGSLKPLRDTSGMMIAPVIANLGSLEALSFKPNPSEVEEIFTLTLEHLCQPQNRGYTHFRTGDRYGYTLPVFHSPKHKVWGLTAVALDYTLKLLIPPEKQQDCSLLHKHIRS